MIVAAIAVLLFSGAPENVAGFVVAIHVIAIQGGPRRARPHIGKERVKALVPSGVHGDTATAVVFECLMFRIETPGSHRHPRTILRRYASTRCVPVRPRQTPATLCVAASKRSGIDDALTPT